MRAPGTGVLAAGVIGAAALLLVIVGAPSSRPAPAPRATPTPAAPSVSGNGVTHTSAAIDLPADHQLYPQRPHADAMNRNCASCHSPSMVLGQPPLTPDQWAAEVKKMREVYRAPVPDADVPAILDYLNGPRASGSRSAS